jgi:hypothetical protein
LEGHKSEVIEAAWTPAPLIFPARERANLTRAINIWPNPRPKRVRSQPDIDLPPKEWFVATKRSGTWHCVRLGFLRFFNHSNY